MKQNNTDRSVTDRSEGNLDNRLIYTYLKKEDLAKLSDEEFALLQTKLHLPTVGGGVPLHYFTEGENGEALRGGARTMTGVYKRALTSDLLYFECFYKYSQIFSLCHTLHILNLYDIGCGQQLQAFLLMHAPEMSYTGIDLHLFHNPLDGFKADAAYINELFHELTGGDQIYFVEKAFPYDLWVEENNIALLIASLCPNDEKGIRILASQLSEKFERIIMNLPPREFCWDGKDIRDILYKKDVQLWTNPFEKYFELWKRTLPAYKFYRIGADMVFATKIERDTKRLERNYTIVNDRILSDVIDTPWHNRFINL